jgi:hypothetical protein
MLLITHVVKSAHPDAKGGVWGFGLKTDAFDDQGVVKSAHPGVEGGGVGAPLLKGAESPVDVGSGSAGSSVDLFPAHEISMVAAGQQGMLWPCSLPMGPGWSQVSLQVFCGGCLSNSLPLHKHVCRLFHPPRCQPG